jgi:hypothetical protein
MSSNDRAAEVKKEVLTDSQPMEDNSASQEEEKKMEWSIYPHEDGSGDWVVEALNIDGEGEIFTTIFTNSDAESRAREYYAWQTTSVERPAAA